MKKNFKKIVSLVLTVLMLVGTMAMLVPVTASAETITITPNADNWINGQNYRLETSSADSYAKIENGNLVLNIGSGDLFWIPSLTVKDNTSAYTFENIKSSADNSRLAIMNHVTTSDRMYGTAICNSAQWIGYRYKWNENGIGIAASAYDVNYGSTTWDGTSTPNGSTHDGSWGKNTALSVRTTFESWGSASVPRTFFYENTESLDGRTSNKSTDVNFRWYPSLSTVVGTSFGLSMASGRAEFTIDKITATNMNEIDSFVETFDIQSEPVEPENVINLVPNSDNWINGQNYRLETASADSYAKIENGKLVVKMTSGDLFWIPTLTVKDTTSEFSFTNMSTDKDGTRIAVATHILPQSSGSKMYSTGIANNGNNVWLSNRLKWNGNGVTIANYDQHYKNDVSWSDSSKAPADGNWQTSETLNIRNVYTTWSKLVPKTLFYVGNSAASQFVWYPSIDTGCEGTSFGLTMASGTATITIDTISALNMNETEAYTETFDNVSTEAPTVSDALVSLSLDGTIGLNFSFEAGVALPAGATVAVTKNGEALLTQPVVNGANLVTAPVAAKEMTDEVNFSIMVDGNVFGEHSYTTSVKKYAEALMANDEYNDWDALVSAMLNYGAAAQKVLDYKTDSLAADISNGVDYDFSEAEAITFNGDKAILSGLYMNLSLEADTVLNLYVKAADGNAPEVAVNGEAVELTDNGDGFYVAAIAGIAADELVDDFAITVNGELSFAVNALDWARIASEDADENVATLANALAVYANEALAKKI